ncbi:MAG: NAD-dependent epimerase/dehydratase family protein [Candidatus Saganbacteria bacterium]|nr:NAD-dependent epimerase/dehydratase family protein [Candidatus Saganbacteria bacterium]
MGLRYISECEPHPKRLIPPLKHNKYFVIGGSGFIGTAIRNLLIRNPQTSVTVLSRDPFPKMFPDPHYLIKVNEKTGLIDWIGYPKQANLEILNFRSSVAIQSCNILKEIKRLREIIVLKDSVIINSSGNNDVRAKNISDYTDDILMTGILIALKEKTQRFIQISSTEVYGSRPISDRGFCEDDDLDKLNIPINREQLKYLTERAKILIKIIINRGDQNSKINEYIQYFKNFNFPERWYYGISRRIMEELLLEDKKAVILRVSNVFGGIPLQPGKVFTIFFSKALNGWKELEFRAEVPLLYPLS